MKNLKLKLKIQNFLESFKREIQSHKLIYGLLFVVLVFSTLFRLYRLDQLLGFYYDQGRDALRVQDILQLKDLPAIGPTTGIAGLFLGPFWFYLLAPFYWIGKGSPVVAASFISLFDVAAVFLLYWFGKEFYNRKIGLLAAFFWGFSYYLVRSARWFSNPSPLPFFVILLLYGLGKLFLQKKDKYLILISFCLAISLQLEAASAVFFLPAIGVIWLIFRPQIKSNKNIWWAAAVFIAFLIPQFLFEIKNKFLITRNFFSFARGEINTDTSQTWAIPTIQLLKQRILFYFEALFSKLETNPGLGAKFLGSLLLIFLAVQLIKLILKKKKEMTLILIIFLFLPLFCLLFFVGNYGRLYDYYLTGFFPAFIFLFAIFTAFFFRKKLYWPILALIVIWFLNGNIFYLKGYLTAGVDGPTHISLGNQLQAINWIYQDAGEEKFNIDVYVPPVIPYAYDYLFLWYGNKKYHRQPVTENVPLLYTLYEADPLHPYFLDAWLARQEKIADTLKSEKFGGITVERRIRKNQ